MTDLRKSLPARALRRLDRAFRGKGFSELKAVNIDFVRGLAESMPHDQAMKAAIGTAFEDFGRIERAVVRHYGLATGGYVIDVGCGSGRLAVQLATDHDGVYLGLDLVPDLVAHARRIAPRPNFRFQVIDHIGVPEADGRADMVVFFSVLTHLLHEQGYWYLEEAFRVLKPGGRVVLSFLEFADPAHWPSFDASVVVAKTQMRAPLNVFIERPVMRAFAERIGFVVVEIRDGAELVVPEGPFGQTLCVLEKPAA